MRRTLVLFCGGGSGGHLTPGLAVADALSAGDDPPEILFLVGDRPVERRMMEAESYLHQSFPLAPVRRTLTSIAAARGFAGAVRSARRAAKGRPTVAVGTGGYVSVPGVLGAKMGGAVVFLIEPNAVDGRAKRALSPWADRVFRATPNRKRGLPAEVRVEPRSLLVLGGSSGSASLDAAVPAAVAGLSGVGSLRIRHQCGGDPEAVRSAYVAAGVPAEQVEVASFFPNAAVRLAESAAAITRAGALTLAEAAGYGVRPILVPYPHAAGHQLANARRHAAVQGCAVVEEGPNLPERLRAALAESLAEAPPAVRRLTPIDPAANVAELIRAELRRLRG
ncbi:UDP-N-acetylglucosamine--N-acetylmuramyl-(pentapeptide) pyrophosphoryl-undecaprenol N-acetylglucosamine transferase [Alienimonas chondri]|uniref:UDP-N-acetylglucosamine--N-acetylmuramyl- (pentapeptide) pyrophosphoryl-undecaprenol N-acetylglucosamine transferase n=1 Tax=Alienimonas chondri TaxID=2681879 RepID=UPI0014876DDC|nr:UDP-N-acetylglucosamine--N-acetylmuramyl-(pentapeptide) pyrophosphoryl-undecaprenol N-acetylglucosamine transferase [Alienimonas chondri]